MPDQAHHATSRPVISAIAAELFVADIKASCDFFTQKLGFSIVFTYGMGVDTHEEIKQLFLEFQAAGITFFQTLKKEPWGAETFIVKDPDGNLLLFAGPAD